MKSFCELQKELSLPEEIFGKSYIPKNIIQKMKQYLENII